MNTALFNQSTISLQQLSRERYQSIYDAGKKGKLRCPICNESVRLYLGITGSPHFFHLTNKKDCQIPSELTMQDVPVQQEYIERNGFRLPVSRSLATAHPVTPYKEAMAITKLPSFQEGVSSTDKLQEPFIEALRQIDVRLDTKQLEAVRHIHGPMLIIAGAGSGKTRVLTARTAYMLQVSEIDPRELMLVTFTAKAAAEMKQRLQQYPGMNNNILNQLLAGTFHSIFYRILTFHDKERWHSSKLLKKEWQKEQIIKDGGREYNLDNKEFAYDLALQQIGLWKNSLCLPNTIKPQSAWEEKVLFLYQYYEKIKNQQHLFDFDDMLLGCYTLFLENPNILAYYQKRFQYFLIDEFQDINKVQYELITMLASSKNICGVGDDDQSIYSFRGSDNKYLQNFEKDFPNNKIIILDENYRSHHHIVATANAIISKNKERRPKRMHAQRLKKSAPILFYPYDEEEEATMILQDISEKIRAGYEPNDFAILFRTNTGSRAVFERLTYSSLPFTIDSDVEPFYERFIVKGMLSFLRLVLNEDDLVAIKDILPVLFVKNTLLRDIKADNILNDLTLLETLSQVKTGFAFQEKKLHKLPHIIRSLKGVTPLTAIETIEKEFGYGDYIKKRSNEGNKLEKGSDDIRDLKVVAKRHHTLPDFLQHTTHMTAMNKEIKNKSKHSKNSITLSTIHRSKGLEYKVVYILGAVDGSIPHEYALDSLRNGDNLPLEEERRLLYVAVTRAVDELFISIPEKRRGKITKPSRFLAPVH